VARERRVLVPIGDRCPFGCRYCYAENADISAAQSVDAADILTALSDLDADSYDIIQLGYDGDPLASTDRLHQMLPVLADTGKHINISTKGTASARLRRFLGLMHDRTPMGISLNVSATCWGSAKHIEPRTPAPGHRLKSAARLKSEESIPFVLSLRPLLPSVPDRELHRLLDCSLTAGATAVVTGPLYVHPDEHNMAWSGQQFRDVQPERVSWSPVPLSYKRIDDVDRIAGLREYADLIGLALFSKNAPALTKLIRESACLSQHQSHYRQV
jgi:DNA repair photolyase